jgi:anti-anti-sigma factor
VDLTVRAGTAAPAGRRIQLDGEYDLSRKDELHSIFASLAADGPATIDLTNVSYVDSTFLHLLATLHFRLNGHEVTLIGVSKGIRRLLRIVSFDQLFHIPDP